MSQYPYQPPPYIPGFYNTMPAGNYALSKARSAGIWQIVLAALIIAYSLLNVAQMLAMTPDAMIQEMQQQGVNVDAMPHVPGWTPAEFFRATQVVAACAVGGVGVLLLVAAIFVRKGSRAAMILSCIVLGAMLVLMLMGLALVQTFTGAPAGSALLAMLIPLALCVVVLTRMVAAFRQPAGVSPTQQQAYWMMMQQQQLQPPQQYGYGYGAYPDPPGPGNPPMPPILPGMPPASAPQNPPPNQPPQ